MKGGALPRGLAELPGGNVGAPGWGQGGPSFQEGLGQEARQEGAGSFWKGGLERPGRLAHGPHHSLPVLSEMGNPWHFRAHTRAQVREGGKEGSWLGTGTDVASASSAGFQEGWLWTDRRSWADLEGQ